MGTEEQEKLKALKSAVVAMQPQAMRQNTQNTIKERIRKLKREIDALEVLLSVIPWHLLSEEDESALWGFFIRH